MKISKKIPSQLDLIPGFLASLFEDMKHLNLNKDELFGVKLALEEALINAIRHGNKNNPDLSVDVRLECKGNAITITVEDEGEGFDYAHLADPTSFENVNKLSGRGIFLIRQAMDSVDFFDGGRGIKMVKFIK